jgi:hypothetical protein
MDYNRLKKFNGIRSKFPPDNQRDQSRREEFIKSYQQ